MSRNVGLRVKRGWEFKKVSQEIKNCTVKIFQEIDKSIGDLGSAGNTTWRNLLIPHPTGNTSKNWHFFCGCHVHCNNSYMGETSGLKEYVV